MRVTSSMEYLPRKEKSKIPGFFSLKEIFCDALIDIYCFFLWLGACYWPLSQLIVGENQRDKIHCNNHRGRLSCRSPWVSPCLSKAPLLHGGVRGEQQAGKGVPAGCPPVAGMRRLLSIRLLCRWALPGTSPSPCHHCDSTREPAPRERWLSSLVTTCLTPVLQLLLLSQVSTFT